MTDTEITTGFPEELPVFSLSGAILLPSAHLSLNIFETHYKAMIDDILGHGRFIGVLQPSTDDESEEKPPLYTVGSVGKIMSFSETEDGRYLIDMVGVSRFRLIKELPSTQGYRRVKPDWAPYQGDLTPPENYDFDRARLTAVLRTYFKTHGVTADWNVVQNTTSEELISSLAMICPLEPNEKQALLEADTFLARVELLITLLEMASLRQDEGETARH